MPETVEQLREELRVKTKIIAEIKEASDLGQRRREEIEASACELARMTRATFCGAAWKLVGRRRANAMIAAADKVLSLSGR